MKRPSLLLLLFVMFCCVQSYAQQADSISLSLNNAENIFLQKNLLLLAQRYQVSSSKALEIQAGLYANPVVSTELALKAQDHPWFDIGKDGQKGFSVDQLILLAGKRNKRIQLAKEDTKQSELALYDLMRTLKFQLRQSFITLAFADILVGQLDRQSELLTNIINAYEVQSGKRNISLKDVVRLKTELIQLNNQRSDIINNAIDARQDIQLLLDTNAVVLPIVDTNMVATDKIIYNTLLEKAIENRSDLQLVQSQIKQAGVNIQYQQALAKPDITVGAGYDQNGSYAPQYFNVHAAIDLPFFNRNQGNIQQAKEQLKIAQTNAAFKQTSIQAELVAALNRIQQVNNEYKLVQQNFEKDYPDINRGIIENFNNGNISILEFLDFFESYNAAIQVINQVKKERTLAYEQLEYVVGAPVK